MNVGEFFIKLGVQADTLKIKDFAKAAADLPLDVAGAISALAGIDYELVKITQNAMNAAVGFQAFGAETGLSWKELQRWQIVAEQANVSSEAVASSVSSLQRQLAEIRLGRGNIAPFQILGIGVNQDAFKVLDQLRDRLKGLEPAMATNLIAQMGIDPSLIHLLQMTDAEFGRLSKTVGGMTGEQEGSFLRAKQELVQFGLAARYYGFGVAENLIWAFQTLYDKLRKFHSAIGVVGIALAGLAIYFAPVTAAVVGLLLVLDDLVTYFRGGDSVFGLAIDGIKKLVTQLDPFLSKLGALGSVATLGASLAAMGPVGIAQASVGAVKSVVQNVTMHITSSAPAHDVGKAAAEHLNRAAGQAALQTNKQGY